MDRFEHLSPIFNYKNHKKKLKPKQIRYLGERIMLTIPDRYPFSFILNPPLGHKSRVYFLLDDWEVVYCGQTEDLDHRIKMHKYNKYRYEKEFTSYRYIDVSKENILNIEGFYINHFQPRFNKKFATITTWQKILRYWEFYSYNIEVRNRMLIRNWRKQASRSLFNKELKDLFSEEYFTIKYPFPALYVSPPDVPDLEKLKIQKITVKMFIKKYKHPPDLKNMNKIEIYDKLEQDTYLNFF